VTFGFVGLFLRELAGSAGSETGSVTVFWSDGGAGGSPGFTTASAHCLPTDPAWPVDAPWSVTVDA
jgi:hypothetical protein